MKENGDHTQTTTLTGDQEKVVIDRTFNKTDTTEKTHVFSISAYNENTITLLDENLNPFEFVMIYRAETDYQYRDVDAQTENSTDHYESTHTVGDQGQAVGGTFTAHNETHTKSERYVASDIETESWDHGSSGSNALGGEGYGHEVAKRPVTSGAATLATRDVIVDESGAYEDRLDAAGKANRLTSGTAERTITQVSASKEESKTDSDTNPDEYWTAHPDDPARPKPEREIIHADEKETISSNTAEYKFTITYDPQTETTKLASSFSQDSDRIAHETKTIQGTDDTTQTDDGQGQKTETYRKQIKFPVEGLPTGTEYGLIEGSQTDNNGNLIGDIWSQYAFPSFKIDAPAPSDPLAGQEYSPRSPIERSGEPGSTSPLTLIDEAHASLRPVEPPPPPAQPLVWDPKQTQSRAYSLMKEANQEHGLYERNAQFAGEVKPILETTAALIAETNPITGPLLSQSRIFLGYDPLTGQQVSGSDRAYEAALTFGPFALGAILSRGGRLLSRVSRLADDIADARFLRKLDDAAEFANPKIARPSLVDDVYNAETRQLKVLQDYCFAPETLIATPHGPRPIGEIRKGDTILAYDHRTGTWSERRVGVFHESIYEGPLVTITTESGPIRATVYHPFWVVAGRDLTERTVPREIADDEDQGLSLAGRWVNSHELRVGDILIGQDAQQRTVLKIEQEFVSGFLVHNLTIEEQHTFAVGPDALLVHNTDGCPNPWGQAGDPSHQAVVARQAERAAAEFPNDIIHQGTSIKSKTGLYRKPDVWVENAETGVVEKIYEAARKNKNGSFVSRERVKAQQYDQLGIPSEFWGVP